MTGALFFVGGFLVCVGAIIWIGRCIIKWIVG